MREILFRGKNVGSGKWYYGYYVNQYGAHEIYMPDGTDDSGFDRHHVIPETVGQYTGLNDMNGTKIFEGDITNFKTTAYHFKNCRIKYRSYHGRYCAIDNKGCEYPMDKTFKYEVIGNIHDNPELMRGAENDES
jgi:uncharacterized phage protein (TIGR01671 family)